ncbi:MAG: hypothetical protein R3F50_07390 [Gammaproteobacteria bacterium]|jgi:NADH:ubiquinone oxidoreductase subunit 4 (subunit M)
MNFPVFLTPILTCIGLLGVASFSNRNAVRNAGLFTLSLLFVIELYAGMDPAKETGTLSDLGSVVVLGNLLACFYTPAFMSSRLTFVLILTMNLVTLTLTKFNTPQLLMWSVPVFFGLLLAAVGKQHGMHRLLLSFGAVSCLLLFLSVNVAGEIDGQMRVAELIGLMILVGLFPLSSWYSRLFEILPTGTLASVFVFQVILVMAFEQQLALDRGLLLLVLPVFAVLSLLMALSQGCARRALAGLAASQLAFLIYADSGRHFSELAATLLAQAQMVTVPGLILTIGTLEMRAGKLNLLRPSGQYDSYPKLASAMLLFGLMGAGFPLSLAYIAEDLILEAGFSETPLMGMSWLVVTALMAILVVKMYLYLCHGRKGHEPGIDILPAKLFAAVLATIYLLAASFTVAA